MPAARRKKVVGKGVVSAVKRALKASRIASRALAAAGNYVASHGYGKPKKAKRAKRGKGFIGKTLGGLGGSLLGGMLPF